MSPLLIWCLLDVDLHGLAHAEGARDDVLVGEVALLLLGHVRLGFLVVLEQRVVARELLDAAVADAVARASRRRGAT